MVVVAPPSSSVHTHMHVHVAGMGAAIGMLLSLLVRVTKSLLGVTMVMKLFSSLLTSTAVVDMSLLCYRYSLTTKKNCFRAKLLWEVQVFIYSGAKQFIISNGVGSEICVHQSPT